MTFISTVIAKQGIIMAADSKELTEGGHLLWNDFDEILKQKNSHENDTNPCIAPAEITEMFKKNAQEWNGRVRSIDGAKKIFKIEDNSALIVSGNAILNSKDFTEIIEIIRDKIKKSGDDSFLSIRSNAFSVIESLIIADSSPKKHQNAYFLCGFDNSGNKFAVFKFYYDDFKPIDSNGYYIMGPDNRPIVEKRFCMVERDRLLNTSGWTEFIGELGNLNPVSLELDLIQAFQLSKAIMCLAITIESLLNKIVGIGGVIYYAAITKNGFYWVNTESDVMNLLTDR